MAEEMLPVLAVPSLALGPREEEARLSAEGELEVISRFDRQLRHLSVSEEVESATGAPASLFVGKSHLELGFDPRIAALFEEALESVFVSGLEREFEFQFDSPEGKHLFHSRLAPERGPAGGVETVICVSRDVTLAHDAIERAREEDLRSQGPFHLSQEILGQLPEGIIVLDLFGCVQQWLGSAEQVTGYTAADAVGHKLLFLLGREDARQMVEQTLSSGLFFGEVSGRHKDGQDVPLELNVRSVRRPDGEPLQLVALCRNISGRKRTEEERARLVEEQAARKVAERSRERLAFLAQAGARLSDSLDPLVTLQQIADLAVPRLADLCVVDLLEPDGCFVRIGIAHRDPSLAAEVAKLKRRYPPGLATSRSAAALAKGETIIGDDSLVQVQDLARDEEHAAFMREHPSKSWARVPLRARGQLIGSVGFSSQEPLRYHGDDLALAEELAARAAVALDNAQLFAREQAARAASEKAQSRAMQLYELTASLAEALSPQEVAQTVAEQTVRAFSAQAGSVGLILGSLLDVVASAGRVVEGPLAEYRVIPLELKTPITDAARTGEIVWISSRDELRERYPHLSALQAILGVESWGGVPMQLEGRVIGALGFTLEPQHQLDDGERAFVLAIARQCAQAFARARLLVEQRERQDLLRQSEERAQRLYQQAADADRRKDEFLAMLGHELRNPIAPITTSLYLMKLRGQPDDKERSVIERQVEHLGRLVDDLLDVSRITRGRIELRMQPIELSLAIVRAVEQTRPLIESRKQTLLVDVPVEGICVSADLVRLAQVVANLLNNAAKYTPRGGRIELSALIDRGQVILTVRDNGNGIAAELLPRVFELFVQGDRALDRAQGGLGIGLTLVRSLVDLHSGTVEVLSEGLGRGTTVITRLPALPALPTALAGPPATVLSVAKKQRRILLVDDNVDAAEVLGEALELSGHTVRVEHDGPAALTAAIEFLPDVVLLDIGLPHLDGFEVARRLRGIPALRNLRLIAVTGYGQESDRARALAAGFDVHLVKPVEFQEIEEALS